MKNTKLVLKVILSFILIAGVMSFTMSDGQCFVGKSLVLQVIKK